MSAGWLLDNSSWSRRSDPNLSQEARTRLADDLKAGLLVVTLPFLLEAGYSAQGSTDRDRLFDLFDTFDSIEIDHRVERRTVEAQAQLTRTGHHRIPPVDLLIAALADLNRLGVLHYDGHYDLILEQTDLSYDSRWLAPRGDL